MEYRDSAAFYSVEGAKLFARCTVSRRGRRTRESSWGLSYGASCTSTHGRFRPRYGALPRNPVNLNVGSVFCLRSSPDRR
jgi:hypothetical protein